MSKAIGHRHPLYLSVYHFEWHRRRNLAAYQDLVAALDNRDSEIRSVAEDLLHRSSPHREPTEETVEAR